MLKQNSRILTLAKVLFDIILIVLAFSVSWALKFTLNITPDVEHLAFSEYAKILFVAIPVFIAMQSFSGMYNPQRLTSDTKSATLLLLNSLLTFAMILIYLFAFKVYHVSRIFTGLFCISSFLFTLAGRSFLRLLLKVFRKNGYNQKYVILVGLTKQGQDYLDAISIHRELGYNPIGIIYSSKKTYKDVPYLGDFDSLKSVIEKNTVDEVVIALPLNEYEKLPEILEICEECGTKSVIVPAYTEYIPAKPKVDEINDIPLINTRYIPLDNILFATIKYGFDFIVSLCLLIVLSPVFLICAILIKLTSPGPVYFVQERIGYNQKPFKIYKFRTMDQNSKEGWTVENDPRVTKIGKFLRKSSLDELPQLINVLKGEMSLVGPRPEQTTYVNKFKKIIPKYMIKHRVRPGITGLAQVNGLRGDTSIEERIRLDIYYIENWNPFLDLKIMVMTLFNREGY